MSWHCVCMGGGGFCHFIIAWWTLRDWHRSENCENDGTILSTSGPVRYEAVLHSCGTSPVGDIPTCDSAHSWQLYSTASLDHQAAATMACYPTQSHYPDSPCPILIMLSARRVTNINFKFIGLTRPGFEFCDVRIRTRYLHSPGVRCMLCWYPYPKGGYVGRDSRAY